MQFCKRRLIFVTDFLLHSVSSLLIANQCWDSLQNFDKILINDKLFNIFYILTVISMFLSLYSYCYYATLMGKVTFEELPAKSQKTSSLPEWFMLPFVCFLVGYLPCCSKWYVSVAVTTAASILFVSLFLSHCSADCKVFEYQLVFGLLVNVFGCSLCVCLYLVSFVCLYHNSCSAWYCYTVFVLLVDVCAGPQIVRCLNINLYLGCW